MKKQVFYSWQSDLPNNTNRGFLETCIKSALRELNLSDEYKIEFRIDKDTQNEKGTPHIANTIFSKIEKASIFIADVSIINSDYERRKSPNPNVLIELGYAAKVLGWDKIICIFNTDYGKFEDLPFDIKFRRPLCYSLIGKEKSNVKKDIVRAIKSNFESFDVNEFVSYQDVGSYLVLESLNYHAQIENKIVSFIEDKKIQQKFNFIDKNVSIDIGDDFMYRFENDEPHGEYDIEHYVDVNFLDDTYTYNGNGNLGSSISIAFQEKFKQVNFDNNKVYSIFEITSIGHSPSGKERHYKDLCDDLVKRL